MMIDDYLDSFLIMALGWYWAFYTVLIVMLSTVKQQYETTAQRLGIPIGYLRIPQISSIPYYCCHNLGFT